MTPEKELLILAIRSLNGFFAYTQNRNITGAQVAEMFDRAKTQGREINEDDFMSMRDEVKASTDKMRQS